MMKRFLISLIYLLYLISIMPAQTQVTHLVREAGDQPSYPTQYVVFNDLLLFSAGIGPSGVELWSTDGRPKGASMVRDLGPGSLHGIRIPLEETAVELNGSLFFSGHNGTRPELWKTDGSFGGTVEVTDFLNFDIEKITRAGDHLFFFIKKDGFWQLWKSDGTATGTVEVKGDISGDLRLSYQTALQDKFIFSLHEYGTHKSVLWVSDGTEIGTYPLTTELTALGPNWGFHELTHFVHYNQELYWIVQSDTLFGSSRRVGIIKTNGLVAGTVPVTGLFDPGPHYELDHGDAIEVDGKLFFSFFEKENKRLRIWQTDGTELGTTGLNEYQSPVYFMPSNLLEMNGKLLFTAAYGSRGTALVSYSPQSFDFVNLAQLEDIMPPPVRVYPADVCVLQALNDSQILAVGSKVNSPSGERKAWISDLTQTGTQRRGDWDGVTHLKAYKGHLYFPKGDELSNVELWRADKQELIPELYQNINTLGYGLYNFKSLPGIGNSLYFPHEDSVHGEELWKYNRIIGRPQLVDEVFTEDENVFINFDPRRTVKYRDMLFFVARTQTYGYELWRSDGKSVSMLPELNVGPLSTNPYQVHIFNNKIYYLGFTEEQASTLLQSDGDQVNVVRTLSDPGSLYPRADYMVPAKNRIYLILTGSGKNALWASNGREDGTFFLDDFQYIKETAVIGDDLYFSAKPFTFSDQGLWISDGKPENAQLIKEIGKGDSADMQNFTVLGDKLIFSAYTAESGRELWVSDGTPEGTFMLKDINPGPASSLHFAEVVAAENQVFFTANDGWAGEELWRTDGTAAGTYLVSDINRGENGSFIEQLTAVDDHVYFQAYEVTSGTEVWYSDGQEGNAQLVADIYPGELGSDPQQFSVMDHQLYFVAEAVSEGRQLFWVHIVGRSPEYPFVDQLIVFPNPATDFIYVANPVKPFETFDYGICDMMGRRIRFVSEETSREIPIKDLQNGNYVLWVFANGQEYSRKFSKQ
jgi:ELWxxDGT repeat protein